MKNNTAHTQHTIIDKSWTLKQPKSNAQSWIWIILPLFDQLNELSMNRKKWQFIIILLFYVALSLDCFLWFYSVGFVFSFHFTFVKVSTTSDCEEMRISSSAYNKNFNWKVHKGHFVKAQQLRWTACERWTDVFYTNLRRWNNKINMNTNLIVFFFSLSRFYCWFFNRTYGQSMQSKIPWKCVTELMMFCIHHAFGNFSSMAHLFVI